jgi:hypothetical protein
MDEVDKLINEYDTVVKVVDSKALEQNERAYGGYIRATKGRLQEYLTEEIIKIAWNRVGGNFDKLEVNSKKIHIPIQDEYISKIKEPVIKNYILENKNDYFYGLSVDKQVFIENKFVMGIECKAYTENAMIKRILVDFHLLKTVFPNISCFLFQLESQLGGDYSKLNDKTFGSKSTQSILSYFPDVNLNIFTFLEGERNINKPIHKIYKPLKKERIEKAICLIAKTLKKFR